MNQQFRTTWSFRDRPISLFENGYEPSEELSALEGRAFILCDNNTYLHCFPLLPEKVKGDAEVLVVPAGEESKDVPTLEKIWSWLMSHHAERSDCLISLGGGVISDLGNFAGSTFKRGMQLLNIPTSLMAQIDAAIGGKCGLNFEGVKNALGSFCLPEAVHIYPLFLKSLESTHFRNGLAEAIKYGVIYNPEILTFLKEHSAEEFTGSTLARLIKECIEAKVSIISNDPFDSGLRRTLNFGHTIGHAIESLAQGELLHGEAVSIGMFLETGIAEILGLGGNSASTIKSSITSVFPMPTQFPSAKVLWDLMLQDKKNKDGKVLMALPEKIGTCAIDVPVDFGLFDSALKNLSS